MVELRILSGLHRGATLPLDGRPHHIGAADDSDVVLVDPGIHPHHATLWPTRSGWLLTPVEGSVRTNGSKPLQAGVELSVGDAACIGNVWLAVTTPDALWTDPPEAAIQHEAASAHGASIEVPADDAADDAATDKVSPTGWRHRLTRPAVLVSMATAAALSVAAYAMTKFPAALHTKELPASANAPVVATNTTGFDLTSATPAPPALSPKELRRAFRKQLASAGLLEQFQLTLGDRAWSMRAELNAEEKARFERILQSFAKEHQITFPLHATVTSDGSTLPFQIRGVISGANAAIVTQSGRHLKLGESYRGVRLAAVEENRVVFDGKRRIEVEW